MRQAADRIGLSSTDATKLATAAVELGRNAIVHAGRGRGRVRTVTGQRRRHGVEVTISDDGPGIADVDAALVDGMSTSGGMGLGLGGARRLVNEFRIDSDAGTGTRVVVVRWA